MFFKCKMCGGSMDLTENPSVICCEYCGTKQTLPRLETSKRENLYDRAGYFRRNNDYDKAMQIYEQILNDNPEDAESYWSLVLCKYGIEYVKDPKTGKRIPTVNRTQTTSVFADDDYKLALKYADEKQKEVYEQEAKAIDDIQKGILEISRKEKPFDVFICYKETDENGRRTQDSVLANDLYHQLTQEGFKVFFARIKLEDKLGTAYEPYIFAALTSAKVMVVLGTCPEHFNAVWVKNEWSRFLSLTKANNDKMLIPAYRDMNPYDLPEEFSHLQSQDMSKLGFMQDLIRGIKKIIQPQQATQSTATQTGTNTQALVKRMFMFIEDGDFEKAEEYSERILDTNPENADVYLGKLLIEHKLNTADGLANLSEPFNTGSSYKRLMMYADTTLKEKIEGYLKSIETSKLNEAYSNVLSLLENAKTPEKYEKKEQKTKLTTNNNIIAISAGNTHTVGLKADGTCVAVGRNIGGQCEVSDWENIIAISAGTGHTVGLKKDGTCVAVGINAGGECNVSDWKDIIAISASSFYTIGLKKDGTCVTAGKKLNRRSKASKWKDIVGIALGLNQAIGLKADGTCVAAGNNFKGACDVTSWKNITNISAELHTLGLKTDGTCVAAGDNFYGQCDVLEWKDIIAISAGYNHTVGLKADGTCVAVGNNDSGQCDVAKWKDIVAISSGDLFTIGLKKDGTCVAVGSNEHGQCDVSSWVK